MIGSDLRLGEILIAQDILDRKVILSDVAWVKLMKITVGSAVQILYVVFLILEHEVSRVHEVCSFSIVKYVIAVSKGMYGFFKYI